MQENPKYLSCLTSQTCNYIFLNNMSGHIDPSYCVIYWDFATFMHFIVEMHTFPSQATEIVIKI